MDSLASTSEKPYNEGSTRHTLRAHVNCHHLVVEATLILLVRVHTGLYVLVLTGNGPTACPKMTTLLRFLLQGPLNSISSSIDAILSILFDMQYVVHTRINNRFLEIKIF